jgi:hypothetical protein
MSTGTNPRRLPHGVLTWVYRGDDTPYSGEITTAVFLLSQDGRSVDRIKLECNWADSEVYSVDLSNAGGNQFHGTYLKAELPSKEAIHKGAVTCGLFDSHSEGALLLGGSSWDDSDGYEYDWQAKLNLIERLPCAEWNA